ncbi:metalloregulator ArsR/SmtB family transcription factor [bacterium]|nr:metalloregulator ArsR/SmtB family transcription factor [bacterium]
MSNLKKITKIIKALADENRIRIVALLKAKKNLCVCEITEIIGLSQPTISSHLKKLQDAEIITFSKDGSWVNYSLDDNMEENVKKVLNLICQTIIDDKRIKSDIQISSEVDRNIICCKKN